MGWSGKRSLFSSSTLRQYQLSLWQKQSTLFLFPRQRRGSLSKLTELSVWYILLVLWKMPSSCSPIFWSIHTCLSRSLTMVAIASLCDLKVLRDLKFFLDFLQEFPLVPSNLNYIFLFWTLLNSTHGKYFHVDYPRRTCITAYPNLVTTSQRYSKSRDSWERQMTCFSLKTKCCCAKNIVTCLCMFKKKQDLRTVCNLFDH